MNCSNFIFDKESLQDYGMIICNWDAGTNGDWSGGEVTFTTIKTPDSDVQTFYAASHETPLSCTLSICKSPCTYSNPQDAVITPEEYSSLNRWLKRMDGYHELQFDQEGYEDIYFYAKIDIQPYYIKGSLMGFDLEITMDSPYGYSQLQKNTFELNADNPLFLLENHSDKTGIIHPRTTLIPNEDGNLILKSGLSDNLYTTEIKNCQKNHAILLDYDKDYFEGIPNPNSFNFIFPVLANTYKQGNHIRKTTFSLDSKSIPCKVALEYRLIRMVTV